MELTAKNVKALPLPAGKSEVIIFDDGLTGFGLRIRKGGARSMIFQYRVGGQQRRVALGSVTADFTKTRRRAEELYHRVRLGEDPAGALIETKITAAQTFKLAADDFLAIKERELRPSSYKDVKRHLLKHSKSLHEKQVNAIKRLDIAAVLNAVRTTGGAVTANRVRTTLSTFFSRAMGEGLVEVNPVIGTNRNKERARERVLSPSELRLIWGELHDDDFGSILKLLALTGQRGGEIAGLRRSELWEIEIAIVSEIDGVKKHIARELRPIPAAEIATMAWSETREGRWPVLRGPAILLDGERTKNHRPHMIPLSPAACRAIGARPLRDRDYVFGLGDGPFSGWSNCKEALDARVTKANGGKPLKHWTPHDLRRSFDTHANEIGVEPHIVEAVLNHVSGHKKGVAGVYNKATYVAQKRTALLLWANHLLAWVEGREPNVRPLRVA